MTSAIRLALLLMCGLAGFEAQAGVPIDALNSANAGLNPALSVERQAIVISRRTGAADALRVMAVTPVDREATGSQRDARSDEEAVPAGEAVISPE